jgi:hypothetical protein
LEDPIGFQLVTATDRHSFVTSKHTFHQRPNQIDTTAGAEWPPLHEKGLLHLKIITWSYLVSAFSLVMAFFFGSTWEAVVLRMILGILGDLAIVRQHRHQRHRPGTEERLLAKIFLTIVIVIAVFGMRLLLPPGHRLVRRRAATT